MPADTSYVRDDRSLVARAQRDTRQLLLEAALETFASKGYEGTTVDALAAAAGFTKGAYYVHFPDKEAVLLALFDAWAARRRSQLVGLTVAASAGRDALISALTAFLSEDAADPRSRALELEFRAQSPRLPALAGRLAAAYEAWGRLLAETFGPLLAAAILQLQAGLLAVSVARGSLTDADVRPLVARLLNTFGTRATG